MQEGQVEIIDEPEIKNSFWHWKRVIHIVVTILLIAFLIWYYLPENKLIRSVDTCGYYAGKNNLTCTCLPSEDAPGRKMTTIFYPNYSYYKIKPLRKYASPSFNFNFTS